MPAAFLCPFSGGGGNTHECTKPRDLMSSSSSSNHKGVSFKYAAPPPGGFKLCKEISYQKEDYYWRALQGEGRNLGHLLSSSTAGRRARERFSDNAQFLDAPSSA